MYNAIVPMHVLIIFNMNLENNVFYFQIQKLKSGIVTKKNKTFECYCIYELFNVQKNNFKHKNTFHKNCLTLI